MNLRVRVRVDLVSSKVPKGRVYIRSPGAPKPSEVLTSWSLDSAVWGRRQLWSYPSEMVPAP